MTYLSTIPAPISVPILPNQAAVDLFHAVKAQILETCEVMH